MTCGEFALWLIALHGKLRQRLGLGQAPDPIGDPLDLHHRAGPPRLRAPLSALLGEREALGVVAAGVSVCTKAQQPGQRPGRTGVGGHAHGALGAS